ncbi:MAG TPA: ABC transporter permease [Acidobacteriaceae bacterium]|nr:ABC transporter permease [Acidobacteriaceae bacterium]
MRFLRFSFDRRKADLDAELDFHRRMAVADRVARGESEAAARAAVERELGNLALAKDVTRNLRGWLFPESLAQDFRYALRQIRRSPGFAATVIATLALGIAAAAAMFTVVDRVLLEPVHYRDSARLLSVGESDGKGHDSGVPWVDLDQWIRQSDSFEQIAFSAGMSGRNFLETGSKAFEVGAQEASPSLFATLGVRPALGRDFAQESPSFAPGINAGQIVLSDAVWKEAFGGNKNVLGQRVKINDQAYTVIGVMPPAFEYPPGHATITTVWTAVQLGDNDKEHGWNARRFDVIARLRPGVTQQAAAAEMDLIQKRVAAGYPNDHAGYPHAKVERYANTLVNADIRRALLALLAAAVVLWLIAALNVTNLLLARATSRQREIAMRGALGASRPRIVQQMLIESLVFSAAAGLLGIALAVASVKLLAHELARHLPLPVAAWPNAQILLALLGLTLVSVLLAAVWPSLLASHAPIEPALRQGGAQAGTGRRHHRLRGVLVAAEVALSLILLVGCGLLLRTIYALSHVPLGFRTDHIVVAHLDIPSFRFAKRNMTADLYTPLLDRTQHLHGVESAGLVSEVPLARTFNVMLYLGDDNQNAAPVTASIAFKAVTPGIQRVFGYRVAAGRFFDANDTPTSQPVAVVNEEFAREHSPDKHNPNAILGTKSLEMRKKAPVRIVGILDDTRQFTLDSHPSPELDIPLQQLTPDASFYSMMEGIAMDLAVRTSEPTKIMIPEIRDALRQASPELAGADISTMDEIVEDSFGSQRLAAHLLEIFGFSALLLCVAGLYGLLAYIVTQRTREMGVRIALGAPRANLLWLVLRQAGIMLVLGVAAGSALAWASSRLLRGFLYGVQAHDGWTLSLSAILLFLSGMLAAYLPARRASRVDPMQALRAE